MKNEKLKTNEGILYLLIGGGIGAVLALLFAPKSGLELRGDIAAQARQGLDKTEELAGQFSDQASTLYEDTKTKAGEIYDSAKQKLNPAAASTAEALDDLQIDSR